MLDLIKRRDGNNQNLSINTNTNTNNNSKIIDSNKYNLDNKLDFINGNRSIDRHKQVFS